MLIESPPLANIYLNIDGCEGMGDKIQFSSLPETFYKWHGVRLIDATNCWVFDHNPYVRRDVKKSLKVKFEEGFNIPALYCEEKDWVDPSIRGTQIIRKKRRPDHPMFIKLYPSYQEGWVTTSRNVWLNQYIGINPFQKLELDFPRGPRLYKYEDPNQVKKDQITIHVGPSRGLPRRFIPDYVLNEIKKRYSSYNIIQIGSEKDHDSPFIDKRGLPIWETIEIIAKSSIFIGINSGPMHVANCYPHINKKMIASAVDEGSLKRFEPLAGRISEHFSWVDYGWQYYTTDDYDVGRLYSYKRI